MSSPAGHPKMSDIASQLVAAEPALLTSGDFGPHVHQGIGPGPSVIIGDQSEIGLYAQMSLSRMDYRMAWLAAAGDAVIVRHRDRVFESYFSGLLGLEDVTFLQADPALSVPVAKQAVGPGPLQAALDRFATTGKQMTLKPYLTTGHTWRLAQHLGGVADAGMHVCGPTPRTGRRANDKLWFADLVRSALGRDAIPPSMPAYGPAAAAGLVSYLAKRAETVVVKVPDSAGSVGNVALDSADLRHQSVTDIRNLLLERLRATGWQSRYPVLIGVWDADVVSSPSAQLWIPAQGDGAPSMRGIFEQHMRGARSAFVGAARSELPAPLQDRLARDALEIARILQRAGYSGHCSLDAVICRAAGGGPRIHWIECNGRWGGVSIPMYLVGRLCADEAPAGLLIVQEVHHDLPQLDTSRYLAGLADLLAKPGPATDGIIVLSPPRSRQGVMLNWLVLAARQEMAVAYVEEAVARVRAIAPLSPLMATA